MTALADRIKGLHERYNEPGSDCELERDAAWVLLQNAPEILTALSTAADAERLKAENERMREALAFLNDEQCWCEFCIDLGKAREKVAAALSEQQEPRNGQ